MEQSFYEKYPYKYLREYFFTVADHLPDEVKIQGAQYNRLKDNISDYIMLIDTYARKLNGTEMRTNLPCLAAKGHLITIHDYFQDQNYFKDLEVSENVLT